MSKAPCYHKAETNVGLRDTVSICFFVLIEKFRSCIQYKYSTGFICHQAHNTHPSVLIETLDVCNQGINGVDKEHKNKRDCMTTIIC